jgi:hypothetical protein
MTIQLVKEDNNWVRINNTRALVSTDENAYIAYKKQQKKNDDISFLKQQIQELHERLSVMNQQKEQKFTTNQQESQNKKGGEQIGVQGSVTFELRSSDGSVKASGEQKNLVMSAGKHFFVKKISDHDDVIGIKVAQIGVGTGSEAPTLNDVDLENKISNVPIAFRSVENNIMTFTTTFGPGVATGTIREVGLYNDASPVVLLCRMVLNNPFVKTDTDFLTLSWRIQIG